MNGRTDIYFQEKGIFDFAELVDNRWGGDRYLSGDIPSEIVDEYYLTYNFAAYRAAKDQKKKMSIAVKKQKAEATWSINANKKIDTAENLEIVEETIKSVRSYTPRFPYPSEAVLVLSNGKWSRGLIPLNPRPSYAYQVLQLPVYLVDWKKIEFCHPKNIHLIPPGSPILKIPIEPVPFGLMPPISPKFTKGYWGRIQILFDLMSKWKCIEINEEVEGKIIYIDKTNRYCGISANTTFGSQPISELLSRLWNELDPIVEEDMEDRHIDSQSECYRAAEFTSYETQKTLQMRVKILRFANNKKNVIAMDIDSGKIYHPECNKLKMLPEELHPKHIPAFVTIGRFPKNTKKHLLESKKIVSVTSGRSKDYEFDHKTFHHLKKMQYKPKEAFGRGVGLKFAIHLHAFKIEENEEDFLNFLDSDDEIELELPAKFIHLKKKITKKSPWLVSESLSHSLDCIVQMPSHEFHKISNEIKELVPTLEDSILEGSALIQICHVQTHHLMAVFVIQHPYKKREGEDFQLNTQTEFHEKIQNRIYEEDLKIEKEDKLVLVRTNAVTGDKLMYYRALVLERDDFKSKVELIDCGAPAIVDNTDIFYLQKRLKKITCPIIRIELTGHARRVAEAFTISPEYSAKNPFVKYDAKFKRVFSKNNPWTNEDVLKEVCFRVSNQNKANEIHSSRAFKIQFDADATIDCLTISQPMEKTSL